MSSEPPNPKPKSFFDRLAAAFHEEEVEDRGRLLSLMRDAQSHNVMDKETLSMMEGALEVSDLRADDLMIPRAQVQEIDLTGTLDDWIRTVIESGHSRFPAVDGDLDNVQGILHAKDLLRLMINPELDVRKLLRPARFIPESQPINVLLRDFKSTRSHLALVIDEFGSISGDDDGARFILKDNKSGKMTHYKPQEPVGNLTWVSHDLTTEKEFAEWEDFSNEQVEDLKYFVF